MHVDLARRDHHLHVDRHSLDALESDRTDPRNHLLAPGYGLAQALAIMPRTASPQTTTDLSLGQEHYENI